MKSEERKAKGNGSTASTSSAQKAQHKKAEGKRGRK
jgi:hypothetical protein